MTYSKDREKIGKVQVERFRNSIRLRFRVDGERYSLTVGAYSKENWLAAKAKAKLIDADIAWSQFDVSLAKYGGNNVAKLSNAPSAQITTPEITIKEIWDNYLTVKGNSLAASTIATDIRIVSKWINSIESSLLGVSNHQKHIELLRLAYGKKTIPTPWRTFKAACNLAVKGKLLENNPYSIYDDTLLAKQESERSRKPFEPYEVKRILEAFESDRFVKPESAYTHSYYYPFVLFLTLTGCRPEDAIALTWADIISKSDRQIIRFNKAFTAKELKGTKTGTIRMFPINAQLEKCLELAGPSRDNDLNLIFPSVTGKYLDLHNFTSRYFSPIVKELVKLGEIENQLPTYHLRHTFITQMIRKGIDIATIANLVGNSPETILKNYLGSDKGITLPNLDI